jgi:hypothetical protein
MSELKPCPFCGNSNILNPINDNGWLCKVCGSEWYRNTRPIEDKLTAELARLKENVELFANQLQAWGLDEAAKEIIGEILGGKVNAPDYRQLRAELARRDEIITKLKEDAERLADGYEQIRRDAVPYCVGCKEDVLGGNDFRKIEHTDWCSVTLHRALMKELE